MQRITRRELLKAGLLLAGVTGVAAVSEFLGLPLVGRTPARRSGGMPWEQARLIIAETSVPSFPDETYSISAYGAVGDGRLDCTNAFQRAIGDCSLRGGGHVVVPPGVYSTGAIELKSGVDLHLEQGAVLRFGGNAGEYPLVLTRYEGIECINRSPMVYAHGQTDIALTGEGQLDASETRPWNTGSNRAAILEPLVAAGLAPERRVIPEHGTLRSAFVEPYACTNVLIQGVTLRQSQFWQLHPTLCRNVTVDSVTATDATNPNTDGCNPESCDHVVIKNCSFATNDDCIAIKSGRDADGRRLNTPCQNIVITGCRLQGSAGGIACGSEMTGGIRNLYVYDVETFGSSVHHLLYVKSNTRRGGFAQNVNLDSIRADHTTGAWAFAQMDYDGQTGTHPPEFTDWTISYATGDFDLMIFQLSGRPGDPIRRLRVTDSWFTHALIPFEVLDYVVAVDFERVSVNSRAL